MKTTSFLVGITISILLIAGCKKEVQCEDYGLNILLTDVQHEDSIHLSYIAYKKNTDFTEFADFDLSIRPNPDINSNVFFMNWKMTPHGRFGPYLESHYDFKVFTKNHEYFISDMTFEKTSKKMKRK